jgi:hypothetical protein
MHALSEGELTAFIDPPPMIKYSSFSPRTLIPTFEHFSLPTSKSTV